MNYSTLPPDDQLQMKLFVENILKGINTALIAEIFDFNPETQRATVRPCVTEKEILSKGKTIRQTLPALFDVPVFFPFTPQSGYSITYPVKKGDYCLVIFSQRDVLNWKKYGGVQPTNEPDEGYPRMFNLNDGFALVGFSPLIGSIKDFQNNAVEIRNDDRNIHIRLQDELVEIQNVKENTKILMQDHSMNMITNNCQVTVGQGDVVIRAGDSTLSVDKDNSITLKSSAIKLDGKVGCSNGATGMIGGTAMATVVDGIVVAIS